MATLAPNALREFATAWEIGIDSARKRSDAATFSGIVGDLAHRASGGYHISREDQPSTNYSVAQFSDDREGPSNLAAAVDMTMGREDMILVTQRLVDAWHRVDPRLDHVRGFNGTLDGITAIRKDAANPDPRTTNSSSDDHTWHIHIEFFRKYVQDRNVMTDVLSVILGGRKEAEDKMEQAYLDYLPDTATAILAGVTPSLGYIDRSGPDWDDEILSQFNVKAVEARISARLDAIERKLDATQKPDVTATDIAREIIAQLKQG